MNGTGGSGLLERERLEQLELQMKELHRRVRALERREQSAEGAAPERFSGGAAAPSQRLEQPERAAAPPRSAAAER
ncbi:MAG: hypothetical protein M3217_10475, partial [Actinomycetota bacterium]|nr:hypothetical protein [Actinomycetota bacterium]